MIFHRFLYVYQRVLAINYYSITNGATSLIIIIGVRKLEESANQTRCLMCESKTFWTTNAGAQMEHLDQAPAFTPTVRTPQYGHTVWGINSSSLSGCSSPHQLLWLKPSQNSKSHKIVHKAHYKPYIQNTTDIPLPKKCTGRSESHPSLALSCFPHSQRCFQPVIPTSSHMWPPHLSPSRHGFVCK